MTHRMVLQHTMNAQDANANRGRVVVTRGLTRATLFVTSLMAIVELVNYLSGDGHFFPETDRRRGLIAFFIAGIFTAVTEAAAECYRDTGASSHVEHPRLRHRERAEGAAEERGIVRVNVNPALRVGAARGEDQEVGAEAMQQPLLNNQGAVVRYNRDLVVKTLEEIKEEDANRGRVEAGRGVLGASIVVGLMYGIIELIQYFRSQSYVPLLSGHQQEAMIAAPISSLILLLLSEATGFCLGSERLDELTLVEEDVEERQPLILNANIPMQIVHTRDEGQASEDKHAVAPASNASSHTSARVSAVGGFARPPAIKIADKSVVGEPGAESSPPTPM